jgi:hypothetical protein
LFRYLIHGAAGDHEKRGGQGKGEGDHQRDQTDTKRPLLSTKDEHVWRGFDNAVPANYQEWTLGFKVSIQTWIAMNQKRSSLQKQKENNFYLLLGENDKCQSQFNT